MDERLELGSNSDKNSTEISVENLSREQIVHYWPNIDSALDETKDIWNTSYTKDELLSRAINGNIQVWSISHGEYLTCIFFSQIVNTKAARIFDLFWMYGEGMREALPCLDLALDDFAAKWNCSVIQITGREAWKRVLRPIGFEFVTATHQRAVRAPTKGN